MEELKFALAEIGEKVGMAILLLVTLWDFLAMGLRGFMEWNIGRLGIVGLLIGILLIWSGSWCRGYYEGRKR